MAGKTAYNLWIFGNGIDRPETAIFSSLPACGYSVTFFHSAIANPASIAALAAAGVECIPLEARNRLDFSASAFLRRRLLSGSPCDLLYAPLNRPLAAAIRATRGTRIPVVGYRGTMGHISRFDPSAWITYLHPRLAHIVTVSDAVKRFLVDEIRIPDSKITRIYKGHDPDWYRSAAVPVADIAAKNATVVIGFAGLIRPVKGVDYLLDAFNLIPASKNARLVLVGGVKDAYMRRRLMAADNSRIIALGFRHDVTALMRHFDIFAMPSVEREGLPRAALEAMSQSLPVVASHVGGLPELVKDGETGFIVPPRDAPALAAALVRLIDDASLRRRFGAAGLARIREHFDYRDSVVQFDALFRRLIESSRA